MGFSPSDPEAHLMRRHPIPMPQLTTCRFSEASRDNQESPTAIVFPRDYSCFDPAVVLWLDSSMALWTVRRI